MFEYHGWATIRTDSLDQYGDEDDQAQCHLLSQLEEKMGGVQQSGVAYLEKRNGLSSIAVFGHNNHRNNAVIELFQWIAENGRASYGLLYIHDDEDFKRGHDHTNVFRVWRLALGNLAEMEDPFLSPYIPVVELTSS